MREGHVPMNYGPGRWRSTGAIRASRLVVVLAVVSLSLIGCGSGLGPDGPDVNITLSVDSAVTAPLHMMVRIAGSEFALDTAGTVATRAPRAGDLAVEVQLLSDSGETLAAAALTHSFVRESDSWIHAQVGGPRPVGFCIGRLTVVPIHAVSDTLFLMDGSLPRGAVC